MILADHAPNCAELRFDRPPEGHADYMSVKLQEPASTPRSASRTTSVGRLLAFGGAVAIGVAAVLPWVTVRGHLPLGLDILGADVTAGGRTVSGDGTAAFPFLLGAAGLVAVLALIGRRARKILGALGLLVTVAGCGLLYYLANVVDIETADSGVVERTAADIAIDADVGSGPYVLIAAGLLVLAGSLMPRQSGRQ